MGKMDKVFYEGTISPTADRNANLLRVYRAPNGEVTIHLRNMKIVLHSEQEVQEWKNGFTQALDTLLASNYFEKDI